MGGVRIGDGKGNQSGEMMCAQVKAWDDLVPESLVPTQDLEECFLYAQRRKGFDTFPIQPAGLYQAAVELGKIKRRGNKAIALRLCRNCGQTFGMPIKVEIVLEQNCSDCMQVVTYGNECSGNLKVIL